MPPEGGESVVDVASRIALGLAAIEAEFQGYVIEHTQCNISFLQMGDHPYPLLHQLVTDCLVGWLLATIP